ncbi:MAG: 30S ribosomal protein S20 [Candidatus Omnitrophica bacterium]|nr:30S ribosomal protein S20 [Candidatus Omnitrophota bacterium]MCM8828307.1 30S ribosomal protein S20 [Candidatus Omnitrophota bacterium]
MPVKKKKPSVLKRQRQEEKRRLRNKQILAKIKALIKKTKKQILDGQDYKPTLNTAIKEIDRAASKGILHKNTAARKKSRLVRTVNKLTTDTSLPSKS